MLSGSGHILGARGRLRSVPQETKAELVINLKTAKTPTPACIRSERKRRRPERCCSPAPSVAALCGCSTAIGRHEIGGDSRLPDEVAGLVEDEAAIVLHARYANSKIL